MPDKNTRDVNSLRDLEISFNAGQEMSKEELEELERKIQELNRKVGGVYPVDLPMPTHRIPLAHTNPGGLDGDPSTRVTHEALQQAAETQPCFTYSEDEDGVGWLYLDTAKLLHTKVSIDPIILVSRTNHESGGIQKTVQLFHPGNTIVFRDSGSEISIDFNKNTE